MNYIKLLNAAFGKFFFDDRLNPTHISLYMALFLEWNSCRFADDFYINRRDLMVASKIGSKSTYHRCLRDLNSWDYLFYFPSKNPYKGSKIKMVIIETKIETPSEQYNPILEQLAEQHCPRGKPVEEPNSPIYEPVINSHNPKEGQASVSNINSLKQINNIKPKDRQTVIIFFKESFFNPDEGKKFFEYYESRNWKTSDGNEIRDWRALAINWMNRTKVFGIKNKKQVSQFKDNLRTTKNKNYGQPL